MARLVSGAYGASGEGWFDGYGRAGAAQEGAGARCALCAVRREGRGARRPQGDARGHGRRRTLCVRHARERGRRVDAHAVVDDGHRHPVYARRRSIFNVSSPAKLTDCPLLIDPTGVYFRPEGRTYICGTSPADRDPDDLPLDEVDHDLFDEVIWPTLANRVPAFGAARGELLVGVLRVQRVRPQRDHRVSPGPRQRRVRERLQRPRAAAGAGDGRGVSELILGGRYDTLDLSTLGWARVLENRPIVEKNVVARRDPPGVVGGILLCLTHWPDRVGPFVARAMTWRGSARVSRRRRPRRADRACTGRSSLRKACSTVTRR